MIEYWMHILLSLHCQSSSHCWEWISWHIRRDGFMAKVTAWNRKTKLKQMQSINIRCDQNISQLSCWLCKCLLLQPFCEPHLHMQRSWDAPAANAGLCQHSRADQITTTITDEVKITLTLKMTEFNFKQWTVLLHNFRYFFTNKSYNWNFLTTTSG